MSRYRLRAYFYLLIVALIWGVSGPVMKIVLGTLPWDLFLIYRFLISTVIFIPFLGLGSHKIFKNFSTFILVIFYAILNTTLGLSLLFAGTAKTSLVSMSLISLFGPILAIFGGYIFLKERVTWTEKLGIVITFVGSFLIIVEPLIKFNGEQGELTGNLLVFASLLAGAVSVIILKELLRKGISPVFLANINFIVGFFTLLPLVLKLRPLSESLAMFTHLSLNLHLGVWYMAILSGTVAYSLANMAQKTIEVSEQAVFGYLYPIISTILAVVLLKEAIAPISYFGGGMTLVGIFIAEVKRRRYNRKSHGGRS